MEGIQKLKILLCSPVMSHVEKNVCISNLPKVQGAFKILLFDIVNSKIPKVIRSLGNYIHHQKITLQFTISERINQRVAL